MAVEPFGVLIAGAGIAAQIHCREYPQVPGVVVRAFADPAVEKAQQRAREYGLEGPGVAYAHFEDALARDDIQVVDICVPNHLHCQVALAAIRAGKHVLLEKPMAQTLAEADAMIRTAREQGVVLGQVFQQRFHRTPRRIKALLESGHLGPLVRARLFGQTIHGNDLLLWLLGDPVRVYAERGQYDPGIFVEHPQRYQLAYEQQWNALVRFQSGVVAALQSGWPHIAIPQVFPYQQDYSGVILELIGQRLQVTLHLWDLRVQLRAGPFLMYAAAQEREVRERNRQVHEHWVEIQRWFDALYPEVPDHRGHRLLFEDFFAAIREGRRPLVTPEEGRRTVELYTGVYQSARDGVVVEFPIREDDPAYRERIAGIPS